MPYATVSEVVQRFPKLEKYSREAQEMFLHVLNAALEQYPDDEGKAIATAWSALYKKYGRKDEVSHGVLEQSTIPLQEIDGQLIIPTIFTREGVQNKGYKPWSELKKAAGTLEGVPVVLGHPPENRPVDVAKDRVIGKTAHVTAREEDHVLHGDTIIQVSEAPEWFISALKEGCAREGSVGYWSDSDPTPGVFNGVPYERVERNIVFDHYAVGIPKGACSLQDGCGLGLNHAQDEGDEKMTINLDELEGEGTVCLDRLKEFIIDVFRRNYKKAPEDREWNFRQSDYTLAQLKRACAVVVGKGDKKEDCKLPHHLPDGTLVWRGVAAAGAALMGARGGVHLSAEDKAKAKRHLEKHYREFGKVPPWKKDEKVESNEVNEKMKLDEEEKQKYEAEIEQLKQEKQKLEAELETYKQKEQEALEKQRAELVNKIVEATKEDVEVYKDWTIEQLEHLSKIVNSENKSEETEKKPADKRGLTPPSSEESGNEPKGSMHVIGKSLTIGSLLGKKIGEE